VSSPADGKAPQPVIVPAGRGAPRGFADSETYRWIRRAVAVAFPLLAVNSIFTAFADNMPATHHLAALIAAPVFVIAWAIEVAGVRWPRLALIAAITIPNLWLTVIGHTETNYRRCSSANPASTSPARRRTANKHVAWWTGCNRMSS
jgi:hypothetical protein